MEGLRARIGIVSPDDAIIDDEYWRFVPDGVTVLVTRFTTPSRDDAISPEMVDTYADLDLLRRAADTLKITRPGSRWVCLQLLQFLAWPRLGHNSG